MNTSLKFASSFIKVDYSVISGILTSFTSARLTTPNFKEAYLQNYPPIRGNDCFIENGIL